MSDIRVEQQRSLNIPTDCQEQCDGRSQVSEGGHGLALSHGLRLMPGNFLFWSELSASCSDIWSQITGGQTVWRERERAASPLFSFSETINCTAWDEHIWKYVVAIFVSLLPFCINYSTTSTQHLYIVNVCVITFSRPCSSNQCIILLTVIFIWKTYKQLLQQLACHWKGASK